jgi:hypothetical protein
VGFWDWLKRTRVSKDVGVTFKSAHTTTVDGRPGHTSVVRDGVEVTDPAEREAAVHDMDELAHRVMAAASAGGGSSESSWSFRPATVDMSKTTTVIVNGRPMDEADPSAREALATAIAKLRAQGLNELADDLEQRLTAPPASATGGAPPVVPDVPAAAAPAPAIDVPPAAGIPPAAVDVPPANTVGDGGVGALSAPTPPSPLSPP